LGGFSCRDDNQDVFGVLHQEGIVRPGLPPTTLEVARFRHLIVHDYGRVEAARAYGILSRRLLDSDAFSGAVRIYL
jgi:uncharacterized protein YutE (UPF0331/DUF86 family)